MRTKSQALRVLDAIEEGAPAGDAPSRSANAEKLAERMAEDRFGELASTIPGVVYQRRVSPDGDIRYTYISEGARDLFGIDPETILRDPEALFQNYGPEYRAQFKQRLIDASREMRLWDVEASIVKPNGEKRYTHAIARPRRQPDGSVLWTGVILDATRMKLAEKAAAATEARTRATIVESLSQGLLIFDADDKLIIRNSHFVALHPELEHVAVPGASYEDILRAELAPERSPTLTYRDATAEFAERLFRHRLHQHTMVERQVTASKWILVNEHMTPEGGSVVLYTDVSNLKQREQRIEHLALHDSLTGLPNRVLFHRKLQEALSRATITGGNVAVMCLDLDRFKNINDTLGHPVGDALLQMVATRLSASIRDCDTAARLGGDEFAVILTNISDAQFATSMAWRLIESVKRPMDIMGHSIVSGTSIGVSIGTPDDYTADELLKNADLALYRAKGDGRGTFRFFESEMEACARERRLLETDLRHAIERGELWVAYQPLVDVTTSEMLGAEALVRWAHPTRGNVTPDVFIPLAEETGLITEIGKWVLTRACTDAMTWPRDIRVAVNVSSAQFRDNAFGQQVEAILAETGLDPKRLEIEITESLLLRDTAANLSTLRRLKDNGVRISMDDFGTGYSSLGNLRSFPFDKIKIDRSFINDLSKGSDAAAIIRAVLTLGRSLGMTTTAEGVETLDQLNYLQDEGCAEVQGFYFSEGKPAEWIRQLLAQSHNGVISPK